MVLFDVRDPVAAPVHDAWVTVYSGDTPVAQAKTGVGGTVSLRLETGAYTVLYSKPGWSFSEDAVTVVEPSTTAPVQTGMQLVPDVAGYAPDKVRVYGRVDAADHPSLMVLVHVEVYAAPNTFSQTPASVGIIQRKITIPADLNTGYFEFDVPRGTRVIVKIPITNYKKSFRVPSLTSVTTIAIEDVRNVPDGEEFIWT